MPLDGGVLIWPSYWVSYPPLNSAITRLFIVVFKARQARKRNELCLVQCRYSFVRHQYPIQIQKDPISVKLCYRVYTYNNNYSITNNNYENLLRLLKKLFKKCIYQNWILPSISDKFYRHDFLINIIFILRFIFFNCWLTSFRVKYFLKKCICNVQL